MEQPHYIIDLSGLDALIAALSDDGYQVIGPALGEGAVVYRQIEGTADLPAGWTESQSPGSYRLEKRDDAALFGFTIAPMSWKTFLHPPKLTLLTSRKDDTALTFEDADGNPPRYAFIGVRSCELAAIQIQDNVFLNGPYTDTHYQRRREEALVIAVQCGVSASTCFCTSMDTGPRTEAGFDLALTELVGGQSHTFVVEVGSKEGGALLRRLPHREASAEDVAAATAVTDRTAASISRRMDTDRLPQVMQESFDHPRYDDVASRCLSCANCTMVCPTCFCTGIVDQSSLDGLTAERVRQWESCFTGAFSYMHGGSVRRSAKSRYRQWLTHKLGTWHEQFGTSGCVGCGRCITWCPVGIDLTEEVAALRLAPEKTEEAS